MTNEIDDFIYNVISTTKNELKQQCQNGDVANFEVHYFAFLYFFFHLKNQSINQ